MLGSGCPLTPTLSPRAREWPGTILEHSHTVGFVHRLRMILPASPRGEGQGEGKRGTRNASRCRPCNYGYSFLPRRRFIEAARVAENCFCVTLIPSPLLPDGDEGVKRQMCRFPGGFGGARGRWRVVAAEARPRGLKVVRQRSRPWAGDFTSRDVCDSSVRSGIFSPLAWNKKRLGQVPKALHEAHSISPRRAANIGRLGKEVHGLQKKS